MKNLLLSLLSSVLLGISWHYTGGVTPFIFIGFVPLLIVQANLHPSKNAGWKFFGLVWLSLFVWNLWTTGWLWNVEEDLATKLFSLLSPSLANSLIMTLPFLVYHKAKRNLTSIQASAALLMAWIAYEYFHLNWEFTWPWLELGNVFANRTSWIQWYEYTGVHGGTLWVLLMNLLFFKIYTRITLKQQFKSTAITAGLIVLLPILFSVLLKKETYTKEEKTLPVVIVQPNLDPYNGKFIGSAVDQIKSMVASAATSSPSSQTALWLFPETAVQEICSVELDGLGMRGHGFWENNPDDSKSINILKEASITSGNAILTGAASNKIFKPTDPATNAMRVLNERGYFYETYNTACFIEGDELNLYHKSILVPGAEIMPYAWLLKPLNSLAVDFGGISGMLGTQDEPTVFKWKKKNITLAPAICYESVFGEYIGEFAQKGAEAICIITNDGWWGNSGGHKQHWELAKLRAIESRRYVARCANTGISGVIDWNGNVVVTTEYWKKATILEQIKLNSNLTFYNKYGDFIGRLACMFSGLMLALIISKSVRNK